MHFEGSGSQLKLSKDFFPWKVSAPRKEKQAKVPTGEFVLFIVSWKRKGIQVAKVIQRANTPAQLPLSVLEGALRTEEKTKQKEAPHLCSSSSPDPWEQSLGSGCSQGHPCLPLVKV